jgi:hypothetical protein
MGNVETEMVVPRLLHVAVRLVLHHSFASRHQDQLAVSDALGNVVRIYCSLPTYRKGSSRARCDSAPYQAEEATAFPKQDGR